MKSNIKLTEQHIHDALEILRGAVTIVHPMNIPPYDPIRMEFENREELAGTQDQIMVRLTRNYFITSDYHLHVVLNNHCIFCLDFRLSSNSTLLSGKELLQGKKLADFIGRNEKTKVVKLRLLILLYRNAVLESSS